jgi:hypothetical protein
MSTFKIVSTFFGVILVFLALVSFTARTEEPAPAAPPYIVIEDELLPKYVEIEESTETIGSFAPHAPSNIDKTYEIVTEEQPQEETTEEVVEEFVPDPYSGVSGRFKSWTQYTVYAKSSKQYKLQQIAYTDYNGLRKVGDYFCVALGSYYGEEIGLVYEITLEDNGEYKTFKAVLCDQKSDRHTDATHRYTKSCKCMVEFAIDRYTAQKVNKVVYTGTVGSLPEFRGSVVKIQNIGKMDITTGEVTLY